MKLHLSKTLLMALTVLVAIGQNTAQGAITTSEGTPTGGVTPVTVTFTNNSQNINFGNYVDTDQKTYLLLFDTTSTGNNYFQTLSCSTDVAVQIGAGSTGSGLYITDGHSGDASTYKEYGFGGTITGGGEFKFSTTGTPDYFNFIFSGNMSAYTGNMTLDGNEKHNKLTFNNNTSGTGAITALGSNSVIVNGATMNNSSIQVGTLSVSGTSTFSGDVFANTLSVDDGSNVTFNGTLDVQGSEFGEIVGYAATASSGIHAETKNGYAIYGKWLVANNRFTLGEGATLMYAVSTEFVEGTGVVATAQEGYGKVYDKTRFYVNEGTVTVGENGYTDTTANTYVVATGATIDLNGKGFDGKTITLAQDSVLANSAGELTDNSILLSKIELTGNAKLNIAYNHGLLTRAWGKSDLALNGYTLTKEGSNTFYLVQTNVTGGGEITTTEGTLQIGSSVNNNDLAKNKVTTADGVVFSTSEQGKITLVNGAQLHAKAITGTAGSIEGAAGTLLRLTSEDDHNYGGAITGKVNLEKNGSGTQALNGSNSLGDITLNAGALAFGGDTTADSLTMGQGVELVFSGGKLSVVAELELNSSSITLAQNIEFATAADYELLSVTGAGNTLSVTGWETWAGNTYNIGGVNYITGLNLENNTLSLQFTAMPIPEPTTATLSLLALAGLAARRRRK